MLRLSWGFRRWYPLSRAAHASSPRGGAKGIFRKSPIVNSEIQAETIWFPPEKENRRYQASMFRNCSMYFLAGTFQLKSWSMSRFCRAAKASRLVVYSPRQRRREA